MLLSVNADRDFVLLNRIEQQYIKFFGDIQKSYYRYPDSVLWIFKRNDEVIPEDERENYRPYVLLEWVEQQTLTVGWSQAQITSSAWTLFTKYIFMGGYQYRDEEGNRRITHYGWNNIITLMRIGKDHQYYPNEDQGFWKMKLVDYYKSITRKDDYPVHYPLHERVMKLVERHLPSLFEVDYQTQQRMLNVESD